MRDKLYCLFFPHPKNNHRANLLHHKTLLALIAVFVFSSLFFPSSFNPLSERIHALAEISTQELLNDTNNAREQNRLPDLANNSQLTLAATAKANDMFAKDYWAHNSPDGTTPWVFIKNSGYDYIYAGENLARGFNSAKDVVNAWMASPDHRENLLSSNFKDVGFAVKAGKLQGEDTFLVVQEFGSKEVPAELASTNQPGGRVLGFSSYLTNSSLSFSSKLTISVIILLLLLFTFDAIIIKRKKIARVMGHNADHVLFMLTLACIVVILGLGQAL